jgi:MoxR-vWA-beta-propeller ternary system domain bpX4
MCELAAFLGPLFRDGRAILHAPPQPCKARAREEALAILEQAYLEYRLHVAGPLLPFIAETGLAAAGLVQQACWFLVSRTQPAEKLHEPLRMPGPPRTPGEHLSADLTLRFLCQVYQRSRAVDPADPLTTGLATLLRQWPLTGVLSGVTEPPLTPPDFGHPGLQMLYAERLAENEKPAWLPPASGLEYVELVWTELGRDPQALIQAGGAATVEGLAREGDDRV